LNVAWREDIDDVREYDVGRDGGGSLDKSVAHMRKEMHMKVSTVMWLPLQLCLGDGMR
jgi:hypothetical protein